MSWYTAGEVVVWMLLSAALGAVVGWLAASARFDARRRRSDPTSDPGSATARPAVAAGGSGSSGPIPRPTSGPDRVDDAPLPRPQGVAGAASAFRGAAPSGPGGGPPGPAYVVKANVDSMTYHLPGTPTHRRVTADVWFKDADAARAAGFRPPPL